MPSITVWTRIEPRSRDESLAEGLRARTDDPLWLLARQWQLGEFEADDAGSPVRVDLAAESSRVDAFLPGIPGGGEIVGTPYDPRALPLEALVEPDRVRGAVAGLQLAVEAGLHFLRLLAHAGLGGYRDAFTARYPIAGVDPGEDEEAARLLLVSAGRVPDGARLYADLAAGAPAALAGVSDADRDAVKKIASAWIDHHRGLFIEPGEESAWSADRLEYAFALAAEVEGDRRTLLATEYGGDAIDWYHFTWHATALLAGKDGEANASPRPIAASALPVRAGFRGMPAKRFWELEDAAVDLGAIDAGPGDLPRLLLSEFALVYGGDWFVVPLELDIGTITSIETLTVIDSFGRSTEIPHHEAVDTPESSPEDGGATRYPWQFFHLDDDRLLPDGTPPSRALFLPPSLPARLEGAAVEDVLFLRDEIASMAWAVERVVEGASGQPVDRMEAWRKAQAARPAAPPAASGATLAYRIEAQVPDPWIPLIASQLDMNRPRLRRVAMPDAAGLASPVIAKGRVLAPEVADFYLYDEEVPREGTRVARSYRLGRWIGGETVLWAGRTREVGGGEGSAGLIFDRAERSR
jgi:hypothetical protein